MDFAVHRGPKTNPLQVPRDNECIVSGFEREKILEPGNGDGCITL